MKITAKMWAIIGTVISIIGLVATLLPSGGGKTNSGIQSIKGHENIQIQGTGNNVNKR